MEIVDCKWHPFKSTLGFATHESVYIYSTLSQSYFPKSSSGLTHDDQFDISCLAWKPFAACTIAVGCQLGVCLWRLFFDHQQREPSIDGLLPLISDSTQAQAWMVPLFVPGLENTSCLSWSPDGRFLVVGYKDVRTLVVWDVAQHIPTILSRGRSVGTTRLQFSPDGNYLLQSLEYIKLTSTNQLHIWETATWDLQKLTTASKVTSMEWIPSTNMFFFTLQESPKVHLLQVKSEPPNVQVINAPSLDLPTLNVPAVQSHSSKQVKEIKLDPTGTRLAVTFEGVSEVGLYQLRMRPLPELVAIGWIYGPTDNAKPLISFANKFKQGALLSIRWDEHCIGFLPCYFNI